MLNFLSCTAFLCQRTTIVAGAVRRLLPPGCDGADGAPTPAPPPPLPLNGLVVRIDRVWAIAFQRSLKRRANTASSLQYVLSRVNGGRGVSRGLSSGVRSKRGRTPKNAEDRCSAFRVRAMLFPQSPVIVNWTNKGD